MERIQVLDAGNTRVKLAVFENDTLLEVRPFDNRTVLLNFLNKNEKIVLSSVVSDAFLEDLKKKQVIFFKFTPN